MTLDKKVLHPADSSPTGQAALPAACALDPDYGAAERELRVSSDELATVCSVANSIEAEIIGNALRAEGIRCFVQGEQQAAVVGTLGIPIGIQVPIGDLDRARKFIRAREEHRQ